MGPGRSRSGHGHDGVERGPWACVAGPTLLANPQNGFDAVTGGQDILVAAVQFEPLAPGTSNLVKYLLAGVIGVVVVDVAFLMLALIARRRPGVPARPAPAR